MHPEASFIAETSFVDAPLNSRLAGRPAAREERLTTKKLRQLITGSSGDEDDESDLQQLDDQPDSVEDDDNDVLDDLSQADLDIQEALLVEDLLGVLVVSAKQASHRCAVAYKHLCLQGVEGQYIRIAIAVSSNAAPAGEFEGPSFKIDESIGKRVLVSLSRYAYIC